jgi:hypothetical protein
LWWILLAGILMMNFSGLLLVGIIIFAATTLAGTLPVECNYSNRAGPVRNNEDTCAVVAFSDSLKWATERMLLPLKRRTKNAWA